MEIIKKVSVILPTFNGASRGFLLNAIESVLTQSYKNFELIIIDDGSIDETNLICKNYLNYNVKYYYQTNKGLAAARNRGILESSGGYICFIDDDDIWLPEKLEKQIYFFQSKDREKTGMVFSGLYLIDEKNNIIGKLNNKASGDIYNKLLYYNIVNSPSSVLIKRNVFDNVGLFKEELKSCEDYDLWIRISRYYNIYSEDEILLKYRLHSNNMSRDYKKMDFYAHACLYYAIENDKSLNENLIFGNLYRKIAGRYFRLKKYKEFRRYQKISEAYCGSSLILKMKYLLSFFPKLSNYLLKIKQKDQYSFPFERI